MEGLLTEGRGLDWKSGGLDVCLPLVGGPEGAFYLLGTVALVNSDAESGL